VSLSRLLFPVSLAVAVSSCGYRWVTTDSPGLASSVRFGHIEDLSPGGRLGDRLRGALRTELGADVHVAQSDERSIPELVGRVEVLSEVPLAYASGVRLADEVVVRASVELRADDGRLLWLSGPVERRAPRLRAGTATETFAARRRALETAVDELAHALAMLWRDAA
jgi:hypothetical protein